MGMLHKKTVSANKKFQTPLENIYLTSQPI